MYLTIKMEPFSASAIESSCAQPFTRDSWRATAAATLLPNIRGATDRNDSLTPADPTFCYELIEMNGRPRWIAPWPGTLRLLDRRRRVLRHGHSEE